MRVKRAENRQNNSALANARWVGTAQEYCQNTTLHGLKYVGNSNISSIERFFWIVSFSLAVVVSAYFITNIYQRWENPVINSIAPVATPIFDIPFPAITICNMNKARRSVAEIIKSTTQRTPLNELHRQMLSELCGDPDTNSTRGITDEEGHDWDVVMNFMVNVTQPCHEMLVSCQWRGDSFSCDNIFNAALTDEGICCSFNRVRRDLIFRNPAHRLDLSDLNVTFPYPSADWTPETGYPPNSEVDQTPWRPWGIGSRLGLSIILDSEQDDYYCSSTSSFGFKMLLHNPVETPKIAALGSLIQPGMETRVEIHPMITHTSSSLQQVSRKKRQCVFQKEKHLRFYRTYTLKNCIMECEANFTFDYCNCVSYYMPKDRTTKICGKKDENCALVAREAMELRVANSAANLSHLNITDVPSCDCLPGCSELTYTFTGTSSHFAQSFRPSNEWLANESTKYFMKNMAVVNFYFTETLFSSRYKGEIFGFTEFLSNTGGILGLFLGFSFLSAVEAIYFLSLRLYCSWYKSQRAAKIDTVNLKDGGKQVKNVEPIPYLK